MMDTTETYIKQCEKAKEIQALRKATQKELDYHGKASPHWAPGDFYTCTTGRGRFDGTFSEGEDNPPDMFKPIWLPRQDQLQEILADKYSFMEMLTFFWEGCADGKLTHFDTWEQGWLTFAMKEKYNKVWNGEDWENA